MQDVAIFWDYENCSPPSNASGYIVANNIRLIAQAYGSIKSFKAYLEITDQVSSVRALALRSEFQSSGVSLIDCPHNGRKEVADKMIIVDMLAYAIDNPPPSVVVLISGDRDFAYALSILRLRQYQVILVTLSNAHPSLTSQASACFDWHSEIINPVVQSPSRTASNPTGSVSSTAPYRDSPPGQSSPSQSSQYTLTQETEPIGRTDHGDLLHYLRASTSSRPRRTSDASFSIGNGQQARYERPRQDASPPIEVELAYVRPNLVSKSTTDWMKTSASNGSSLAISDSVHNPSSTLACGTKDAVVDATDMHTSFFSLSADHEQPFSASLPKIDGPAPTLLPSIMQETPQYSPVAQCTILETDSPDDDSTCDVPFAYPIRPLSAHSLPSQSPLVPLISAAEPVASETNPMSSEPLDATESLSIPMDNLTDQSSNILPSQETPRQPISLVVASSNVSNVSIAVSEETFNNDPAPPDITFMTQSSPSLPAGSEGVDQPPVTSLVNQVNPLFTDSQRTIDEPLIADSVSQVETPTSNLQSIVDKSSPDLPLADNCLSRPEVTIPPIFKILVETLSVQKAKGYCRPLRSFVAEIMYRNGFTYENTGVITFGQYTALCEKQGIIETGGGVGGEWISLKADYENTFKPATPTVPPIFKLLVQTLKLQQSKGFPRTSRTVVAYMIYKSGFVYKDAGVNKFGQYAALAEKQGIVELGGNEGDGWISLTPEYRNVLMSQTT